MTPLVCRIVNASSAGVALLAAKMMSPSFSRSASSTPRRPVRPRSRRPRAPPHRAGRRRPPSGRPGHRASLAISRSTYLAITSTSMFTTAPTALRPSVVRARVSGIRLTSNQRRASSPHEFGNSKADTVDGDRALLRHVTQASSGGTEIRRTCQSVAPAPTTRRCRRHDPGRCGRRAGRPAAPGAPG